MRYEEAVKKHEPLTPYKQPFADYLCSCLGCGEPFRLHIYSPQ